MNPGPRAHAITNLACFMLLAGPALAANVAADDACPSGPVLLLEDEPITAWQVFTCRTVLADGGVTVAAGGALKLIDSTLRIGGASPTLTLQSGGTFESTRSRLEPAAGAPPFQGVFLPGSSADLSDSSIFDSAGLRILSGDVTLEDVQVRRTVGVGIRIEGSNPQLRRVAVQGGSTGIEIIGGSAPTLEEVDFLHSTTAGLRVSSPAPITCEACSFLTAGAPIVMTGPGNATLRNTSFDPSVSGVRLESSTTGAPHLRLIDSPYAAVDHTLSAGATLATVWTVRARAVDEAGTPLQDALVRVRDARGLPLLQATTAADGLTPPFLLVDTILHGALPVTENNPWTFLASKGDRVGNLVTDVHASHRTTTEALSIAAPLETDEEPPLWDSTGAGLLHPHPRPGFSGDGSVALTWAPADDPGPPHRGIDDYEVAWTGPSAGTTRTTLRSTTIPGLAAGNYSFRVRAADLSGNPSAFSDPLAILVDPTAPLVGVTFETLPTTATASNRPVRVRPTAADVQSGVESAHVRIQDHAQWMPLTTYFDLPAEGTYNITVQATNRAGVPGETRRSVVVDARGPSIVTTLTPGVPDGQAGWFTRGPVTVTLKAIDDGRSGLDRLEYRLDGGAWTPYSTAVNIAAGDHWVTARAVDRANNTSLWEGRVALDSTPPAVTVKVGGEKNANGWFSHPPNVVVDATDATSGVSSVEHRWGTGPWIRIESPFSVSSSGDLSLSFRAVDRAGHASVAAPLPLLVDLDDPVAPIVRFVAQSDGRLNVDWRARAPSDLTSGIAQVELQLADLNGAIRSKTPLDAEALQQTVTPPAGALRARIIVEDSGGRNATTPWIPVMVPHVAATLDAADVVKARSATLLRYAPTDGFDVAEVRFFIDDQLVAATATEPFTLEWQTRSYVDGVHTVRMEARSLEGAVDHVLITYEVRNDYAHVMVDHAAPLALALIVGVAFAAIAGWALLRSRPTTVTPDAGPPRGQLALVGLAATLLILILLVPVQPWSDALTLAWLWLAMAGVVGIGVQALYLRIRAAKMVPPSEPRLKRATGITTDYDAPWKEDRV